MRLKILTLTLVCCLSLAAVSIHAETYYVSKSGNDNFSGTSWSQAWATPDKVNLSLQAGDTVLFGSGRWFDTQIFPPMGGQTAGWTVYACSTFADGGDGSDSWWDAQLIGGDSVLNWTQYDVSGGRNIWRASWVGNNCWYGSAENDNGHRAFTLIQNDSLMKCELSVGAIQQEGQWTHIESEDMIYAWIMGGQNPNNLEMIASCKPVFKFYDDAHDKIKVYGLDLRAGKQGVVLFTNGACDSIQIVHCKLRHVGHDYGENPALVMSRTKAFGPPIYFKFVTHALIRGCDISSARGTSASYYEHNGTGVEMYCTKFTTVDSCYIHDVGGDGVYWKNELDPVPDSLAEGNVVKFTRFDNIRYYGVGAGKNAMHDSVYGCTFNNIGETAINLDYQNTYHYGGHFIGNNSFYNASQFWWSRYGQTGTAESELKYNAFYDRGSPTYNPDYYANFMRFGEAATTGDQNRQYYTVDSNMYYDPDQSFNAYAASGTQSFSGWQSLGFDTHGRWNDPGFTNPANNDFSRPDAVQEMNVTYGGRTWYVFGAWQPGDPPPDTGSGGGGEEPTDDNLALNMTPSVSGTYPGYTIAALTDGVNNPAGGPATTWASDQSAQAHWVEINFGGNYTVEGVRLYWAWNTFRSEWAISQQFQVQYWNGSSYQNIVSVNTGDTLSFVTTEDTVTAHTGNAVTYTSNDSCVTAIGFAPVTTSRIRVYQPANMGSINYPTVMWLSEFEIWNKDVVPPAIESPDLGALPGTKNGQIELFWKAPGDDVLFGSARGYNIKISRESFTAADWSSLPSFFDPPMPKPAGQQEHIVISNLEAGAKYYVALKAYDEEKNYSSMTNVAEVTAFLSPVATGEGDTLVIESPLAGATLHTSRPLFVIHNIDDADTNTYYFEIARDAGFGDVVAVSEQVIQEPWETTTWQIAEPLRSGITYYWRARANNIIVSETNSFNVLPQTHAYPNPFNRTEADKAVFTELPTEGDIILMTISGTTIKYLANKNGSDLYWDGTNQDGEQVSSGTYLWFVEGTDISGKIVVTY